MSIVNRLSTILAIIFLAALAGCSNSNTSGSAGSQTSSYARTIERANKGKRYFIMYSGVDTYRVTSAQVETGKQQFTVHLAKIDSSHAIALKTHSTPGKLLQMYMRDSTSYTLDEPHTIPIDRVSRIEAGH